MPEREPLARFIWPRGYWPTTALAMGMPDCVVAGQNLWNRGQGLFTTSKGFGGSVLSSGGVNPLLNVAGTFGGLTGGGSITQAFGAGVYFFAGAGNAIVGGTLLGPVQGGTVTIWLGTAPTVAAGLHIPGSAVIADSGAGGHNNGAYSIAITAIRHATGGESSIGPPSNVISVTNHGIKVVSPIPSIDSAADRVGIYATKRGFGSIGPYFHLYDELKVNFVNGYVIQVPGDATPGWIDAQLGDLAPFDFSLPPPCTFCFAINSVIVAAGCYGGAGMSPSYPNRPEAYPARFVVFTPSGAPITAVKGSGVEGGVLVCTSRSIDVVTAGQSTTSPLNIRPKWPNTGVPSANQICVIGDEIYAWIGRPVKDSSAAGSYLSGVATDPGEQASRFAAPVFKFFDANGYSANQNIVVCYDGPRDCVWFINGSVGISYNRWNGEWNLPMTMPANIVTAVMDVSAANRALISDASGNLYTPETGSGTSWTLVTQMQGDSFGKTIIGARAMIGAGASCRMDIYRDLDIVTPAVGGANLVAAANHGTFHHLDLQNVKTFGVGLSGTDSGGRELYGVEVGYNKHPVRQ